MAARRGRHALGMDKGAGRTGRQARRGNPNPASAIRPAVTRKRQGAEPAPVAPHPEMRLSCNRLSIRKQPQISQYFRPTPFSR